MNRKKKNSNVSGFDLPITCHSLAREKWPSPILIYGYMIYGYISCTVKYPVWIQSLCHNCQSISKVLLLSNRVCDNTKMA